MANTKPDSSQVNFIPGGVGAVATDVQSKLRESVSVKDFGAVGDGVTDDTAAIQAAEASDHTNIYMPEGVYKTTLTPYQTINKKYYGPGQLEMGGYNQAHFRSFITSEQPVASTDRLQVFDGGFDKAYRASYMFIGSSATGSPTASYKNFTELAQDVIIHDYAAGFNTNAGDHQLGRSGAFVSRKFVYHGGQGDLTGENFFGAVSSSRAGATHFLANPALIVANGNLGVGGASGAGCYLNHSEFNFSDSGHAVACINSVRNYNRTNAGNTLSQVWIHDRPQATGTQPIDCFYSIAGTGKRGIDFTPANLGEDKAAIILKASDRIYFDGSSTADSIGAKWYANNLGLLYMHASGGYMSMVADGVNSFQASKTDLICGTANGLSLGSTGILRFTGTGQASTGTSTATFTTTNKPGSTTGAGPATWLKVSINFMPYYIPCWAQ